MPHHNFAPAAGAERELIGVRSERKSDRDGTEKKGEGGENRDAEK